MYMALIVQKGVSPNVSILKISKVAERFPIQIKIFRRRKGFCARWQAQYRVITHGSHAQRKPRMWYVGGISVNIRNIRSDEARVVAVFDTRDLRDMTNIMTDLCRDLIAPGK